MDDIELLNTIKSLDDKAKQKRVNDLSRLLSKRVKLLKAKNKYLVKLESINREYLEVSKEICKEQGHTYSNWKYNDDNGFYVSTCKICGKVIKTDNIEEYSNNMVLKRFK